MDTKTPPTAAHHAHSALERAIAIFVTILAFNVPAPNPSSREDYNVSNLKTFVQSLRGIFMTDIPDLWENIFLKFMPMYTSGKQQSREEVIKIVHATFKDVLKDIFGPVESHLQLAYVFEHFRATGCSAANPRGQTTTKETPGCTHVSQHRTTIPKVTIQQQQQQSNAASSVPGHGSSWWAPEIPEGCISTSNDGFLTGVWGPCLHYITGMVASKYVKISDNGMFKSFFTSMPLVIPCAPCRDNYSGNLQSIQADIKHNMYDSNEAMTTFTNALHNVINKSMAAATKPGAKYETWTDDEHRAFYASPRTHNLHICSQPAGPRVSGSGDDVLRPKTSAQQPYKKKTTRHLYSDKTKKFLSATMSDENKAYSQEDLAQIVSNAMRAMDTRGPDRKRNRNERGDDGSSSSSDDERRRRTRGGAGKKQSQNDEFEHGGDAVYKASYNSKNCKKRYTVTSNHPVFEGGSLTATVWHKGSARKAGMAAIGKLQREMSRESKQRFKADLLPMTDAYSEEFRWKTKANGTSSTSKRRVLPTHVPSFPKIEIKDHYRGKEYTFWLYKKMGNAAKPKNTPREDTTYDACAFTAIALMLQAEPRRPDFKNPRNFAHNYSIGVRGTKVNDVDVLVGGRQVVIPYRGRKDKSDITTVYDRNGNLIRD